LRFVSEKNDPDANVLELLNQRLIQLLPVEIKIAFESTDLLRPLKLGKFQPVYPR
jgi:hypothetical protein